MNVLQISRCDEHTSRLKRCIQHDYDDDDDDINDNTANKGTLKSVYRFIPYFRERIGDIAMSLYEARALTHKWAILLELSACCIAVTTFHLRGTMLAVDRSKQSTTPFACKRRWHNRCNEWELMLMLCVCFFILLMLCIWEWDRLQSDKK